MANVKAGDKIVVVRKGNEDWISEMDQFIGRTLTVTGVWNGYDDIIGMRVTETVWRFYNDACKKIGEDGKMQVIDGVGE